MSDGEKKSGAFKWFACGCASCLLLVVAGIAAVVGLGAWGFWSMMDNDAYKDAVQRATTRPEVIDALGEPVKAGTFFSGEVNVDNRGGNVDIEVPLSGPRGRAVLYVKATKHGDTWDFQQLEVVVDQSGERIDLLSPPTVLEQVP